MNGDDRPLPLPVRWLAVAMNVVLLLVEGVLWSARGVNLTNPMEMLVVSVAAATPIVSLAVFLDYNRRGV